MSTLAKLVIVAGGAYLVYRILGDEAFAATIEPPAGSGIPSTPQTQSWWERFINSVPPMGTQTPIIPSQDAPISTQPQNVTRPLAWGKRVSSVFRDRVWWIADQLGLDANNIMGIIAFETGETFSSSIRNRAGAPYWGLLQFGDAAAADMGTTTAALRAMTPEDQLNYVYKYFALRGIRNGRGLSDMYMSVLWPVAVGKPDSFVLWTSPSIAYKQNAGLDLNRDGMITKGEASAKVYATLQKGMQPGNVWP